MRRLTEIARIRSAILLEHMAKLSAQPTQKLGNIQWIGHMHLLDDARRKRMVYAVQPNDVLHMMRRYDVAVFQESN